jgi:hypothetical protein
MVSMSHKHAPLHRHTKIHAHEDKAQLAFASLGNDLINRREFGHLL